MDISSDKKLIALYTHYSPYCCCGLIARSFNLTSFHIILFRNYYFTAEMLQTCATISKTLFRVIVSAIYYLAKHILLKHTRNVRFVNRCNCNPNHSSPMLLQKHLSYIPSITHCIHSPYIHCMSTIYTFCIIHASRPLYIYTRCV